MIRHYCPYCEKEVYWNDVYKGFQCDKCDKILTEDEILMLDDDVDKEVNHL